MQAMCNKPPTTCVASVRGWDIGPQILAKSSLRNVEAGTLLETAWAPQHLSSGLILPGFPSNSAKNVFETETDIKKVSRKQLTWGLTVLVILFDSISILLRTCDWLLLNLTAREVGECLWPARGNKRKPYASALCCPSSQKASFSYFL